MRAWILTALRGIKRDADRDALPLKHQPVASKRLLFALYAITAIAWYVSGVGLGLWIAA